MKKNLFILPLLLIVNVCVAIKPDRNYVGNPQQFGFEYKEAQIKTSDNFLINTWDIKPKKENKNKVTVILCGTDAGNMSYLISQSLNLANLGYNVICFDYRGFGKSQDFKIDTTLLFHQEFLLDFNTAVEYAKQLYPNNKIGTFGFSMGAYFPLITKLKIDFIIGDSPLTNPFIFLERLNKPTIKLPENTQKISISDLKMPQLYILGNQDKFVKIDDIPVNFVLLYKGKHLEGEIILKDNYYTFIDSFLSNLK